MLAFLLDGLSEDLNLVHEKPYTELPDSDGLRSEAELADIWWENHLKRDRSVIQALFTGQFKSVTACKNTNVASDSGVAKCASTCCGYSSARYEPFNFLTAPIPENIYRLLVVYVIPLQANHSVQCAVRVSKTGNLHDVIRKICDMKLSGTRPKRNRRAIDEGGGDGRNAQELYFIAAELLSSRIRSFYSLDRKLDTIKDSESIVFFQVRRPPPVPNQSPLPPSPPLRPDGPLPPVPAEADEERRDSVKGQEEGREGGGGTDIFDPESLYRSFNAKSLVRILLKELPNKVSNELPTTL